MLEFVTASPDGVSWGREGSDGAGVGYRVKCNGYGRSLFAFGTRGTVWLHPKNMLPHAPKGTVERLVDTIAALPDIGHAAGQYQKDYIKFEVSAYADERVRTQLKQAFLDFSSAARDQ